MSSIVIRQPESIYQIDGEIENGTFHGRWHFSFGDYVDPAHTQFGTLRVFNDDTLSPGAVWPLHPHREIEVVTYCAGGEFRHADEHGKGGVLKKGWVQHTTVGRGMWHSEINNRKDQPMRFIQMWFIPAAHALEPAVEQKNVEQEERTNRLLPLVSNRHPEALRIVSDAGVYSSRLLKGNSIPHSFQPGHGGYLYVLEGGPVRINDHHILTLGAAAVRSTPEITIEAGADAELLLVEVRVP
ncbi:MAG: pirin family protein [Nitrospirota bacterium]